MQMQMHNFCDVSVDTGHGKVQRSPLSTPFTIEIWPGKQFLTLTLREEDFELLSKKHQATKHCFPAPQQDCSNQRLIHIFENPEDYKRKRILNHVGGYF